MAYFSDHRHKNAEARCVCDKCAEAGAVPFTLDRYGVPVQNKPWCWVWDSWATGYDCSICGFAFTGTKQPELRLRYQAPTIILERIDTRWQAHGEAAKHAARLLGLPWKTSRWYPCEITADFPTAEREQIARIRAAGFRLRLIEETPAGKTEVWPPNPEPTETIRN